MKTECAVLLLLVLVAALDAVHGFAFGGSASSSPATQQALDIYRTKYPGTDGTGKRYCDISDQKVTDTFTQLAKVYGEDQALEMTRIMPIIMAFKPSNFEPSFREMAEIFGEDHTKGMILRNPGLLEVRPSEAAKSTDQTMVFSYLVSYTRPASPVLLPLLLALLLVPAAEALTGFPIRATFFATLTGADVAQAQQAIRDVAAMSAPQ